MTDEQNENLKPEKELSEKELKKIEKTLLKERRNEVRHILLGNFKVDEKGKFSAGGGKWVTPYGFGDGAQQTLFYGVKSKTYVYKSSLKNDTQSIYKASKAMSDIGRALVLETAPDSAACYVKSMVFRPVVLVFEKGENVDGSPRLELHAYCGRSPIAFVAVWRAVSRFDKALPEEIKRNNVREV